MERLSISSRDSPKWKQRVALQITSADYFAPRSPSSSARRIHSWLKLSGIFSSQPKLSSQIFWINLFSKIITTHRYPIGSYTFDISFKMLRLECFRLIFGLTEKENTSEDRDQVNPYVFIAEFSSIDYSSESLVTCIRAWQRKLSKNKIKIVTWKWPNDVSWVNTVYHAKMEEWCIWFQKKELPVEDGQLLKYVGAKKRFGKKKACFVGNG